jgi:hypothetical protein
LPWKATPVIGVQFGTVSSAAEVDQIIDLQRQNLPASLSEETMASQGFVTVRHDRAVLQRMSEAAPAVIAKAGGRVVAYALVMPREFAADVPVLQPLFDTMDRLSWRAVPLRDNPRWFVMGQICVAEGYRGTGIFEGLYRTLASTYRGVYDFTVTEVAERNTRSRRAHERVGFRNLHNYSDSVTGEVWHVIVLEF